MKNCTIIMVMILFSSCASLDKKEEKINSRPYKITHTTTITIEGDSLKGRILVKEIDKVWEVQIIDGKEK